MKIQTSLIAATLLGAMSAGAATISWSSQAYTTNGSFGQFLDTGIFDTSGVEILAQNIGGGATTFDSINFAADTLTATWSGTFNGFHDPNVPSPDLSRVGSFTAADTVGTISLSGLNTGYTYRVQALVFDGRGDVGIPGRTVEFDGINQGLYANGISGTTWGDGLLVTGTFTADAATQDFTIEGYLGASSTGGQLNALLVHQTAVPEPSSAALLGLGGLAMILRRRK